LYILSGIRPDKELFKIGEGNTNNTRFPKIKIFYSEKNELIIIFAFEI
jgi:hypothetical protein